MRRAALALAFLAAASPALAQASPLEVDPEPVASDVLERSIELPAAAASRTRTVRVLSEPRSDARRLATMRELRYDFRPTVFEVIRRAGDEVDPWFQVQVPGRPNGRRGWVQAQSLDLLYSVAGLRIEIDRSARRLRLLERGRTLLKSPVAVGKRGAPTPLGDFYVTAAFRPADRFLGPWAFETSAYAAITDWPRGGIVGLHGTSVPRSVGRRASHGCLRVPNRVIRQLRKRVSLGTPIHIRQ